MPKRQLNLELLSMSDLALLVHHIGSVRRLASAQEHATNTTSRASRFHIFGTIRGWNCHCGSLPCYICGFVRQIGKCFPSFLTSEPCLGTLSLYLSSSFLSLSPYTSCITFMPHAMLFQYRMTKFAANPRFIRLCSRPSLRRATVSHLLQCSSFTLTFTCPSPRPWLVL